MLVLLVVVVLVMCLGCVGNIISVYVVSVGCAVAKYVDIVGVPVRIVVVVVRFIVTLAIGFHSLIALTFVFCFFFASATITKPLGVD